MVFHRRDGSTFTDPLEAGRLLADIDYRRVAYTEGDGWSVSTVFLVIDHAHFGGPPMLYETLSGEGITRYPNEVAALAGHDQAVEFERQRALALAEGQPDRSHGA